MGCDLYPKTLKNILKQIYLSWQSYSHIRDVLATSAYQLIPQGYMYHPDKKYQPAKNRMCSGQYPLYQPILETMFITHRPRIKKNKRSRIDPSPSLELEMMEVSWLNSPLIVKTNGAHWSTTVPHKKLWGMRNCFKNIGVHPYNWISLPFIQALDCFILISWTILI